MADYTSRAAVAKKLGSVTFEGEQRAKQGKGLDSLVDPKERGVIREANNLLVPVPGSDEFELKFGVAIPVETDVDTTGSMGGNVEIAFKVQPKVQNLLIQGGNAVLRRYHAQLCTGVVQDRVDQFPYQRSMFEPDNEVERQMGLLVPERSGGDSTEDYQLGLFAAAHLTRAAITEYGLRGYYFSVGDEIGRDSFDGRVLEQVFGPSVLEKAFGKGSPQSLPSTVEVAKKLLRNWHGFFLQVGNNRYTAEWWSKVLGEERVIRLPKTEDLAEVQAVIIGLTEGVLDLQSAVDFLKEAKVTASEAKRIVEACSGIPIGLQTTLPNFDKIPMAGATFASREDIWPIGTKGSPPRSKSKDKKPAPKGKEKPDWKL
ncbi:MAG: hypothetical protein HY455_03095 [Parcubacteria group bacterium]|nr:hypothetical protein [Parcubacteria group bacterium]